MERFRLWRSNPRQLVLVAVAVIVLVTSVVWAVLVPRHPRGHGDTFTGAFPIWENNTELRIGIVAAGVLIALVLLLIARRLRSRPN
jgi:hypothetical protein